jgi:ribokinase
MRVVIFGSINMDLVAHAARIARPGETILGNDFRTIPGGKGANQAVAVARMGGTAHMCGAVGDDGFGRDSIASLASYGVDTSGVVISPGATGVALILLDAQGENSITVVSGANMRLTHAHLDIVAAALNDATHLLLQLEIPMELVIAAAQMARARGVTVILDPAPAPKTGIPAELYRACDVITPNATETVLLTGINPSNVSQCAKAAQVLHQRGTPEVIIKRGAQGVYWSHAGQGLEVPGFVVPVVDTVAAGDCFNGALAVGLSEKMAMHSALRFAAASAALSVTKTGAQPSIPQRTEVEIFLQEYGT